VRLRLLQSKAATSIRLAAPKPWRAGDQATGFRSWGCLDCCNSYATEQSSLLCFCFSYMNPCKKCILSEVLQQASTTMGGERRTIFIWYVHVVPMDWQMQMKKFLSDLNRLWPGNEAGLKMQRIRSSRLRTVGTQHHVVFIAFLICMAR